MRCQGPYSAASIPSFATLVAESTPDRAALLLPLVANVDAACALYDAAAPDVHRLKAVILTKDEKDALIDGYDGRTIAIKRRLSNMLGSLPEADADLCPYCSLDTNPDLDHYLPKATFPEFALYGRNLVPICTPCNRKKLNAVKEHGTGKRLFLNPGVEPSQNAKVLEADLSVHGSRILIEYRIDDHGVLGVEEKELVERHSARLGLCSRYAKRARSHLASFKLSVKPYPLSVVRKTLQYKIVNPEIGEPINGWRPALYRAIAAQERAVLSWLTS